jgi:hypothetical protein
MAVKICTMNYYRQLTKCYLLARPMANRAKAFANKPPSFSWEGKCVATTSPIFSMERPPLQAIRSEDSPFSMTVNNI